MKSPYGPFWWRTPPQEKPMLGNIDARRFSLAYPEKSSGRAVIHDAGRSEENDWCILVPVFNHCLPVNSFELERHFFLS